jgi:hypothetical protein
MNPTREHLLGYLLGALDRSERDEVERELARDPALRGELDRLADCVGRIGLADEPEYFSPPSGLAVRTCEYVAAKTQVHIQPARPAFSSRPAEYVEPRHYSWVDLLTAAAVLIAGFAIFFPALSHSRFQAQVATCQNHMRQVGMALHQYATLDPQRRFPYAQPGRRNRAGIYAPTLVDNQLVLDPRSFQCLSLGGEVPQIPSGAEIESATPDVYALIAEVMGGHFGYNMGYIQNDQFVPPRDHRRSRHPLLSDKPSDQRPGRTSANHGGQGQNVMCEDGCVTWCPTVPLAPYADDPYHNREGLVAPGIGPDDAVLGASADIVLPIRLIKE